MVATVGFMAGAFAVANFIDWTLGSAAR